MFVTRVSSLLPIAFSGVDQHFNGAEIITKLNSFNTLVYRLLKEMMAILSRIVSLLNKTFIIPRASHGGEAGGTVFSGVRPCVYSCNTLTEKSW